MKTRTPQSLDDGLRPINPVRAWLLTFFGPADAWDNPLRGTKYDPVVRQHRQVAHKAERLAHRDEHRRAREEHRQARAHQLEEPYTADE